MGEGTPVTSTTIEHPGFRVIDDFLDEPTWTALWTQFQFAELRPVSRTHGAWKLDDGVPLAGEEVQRAPDNPNPEPAPAPSDASEPPNPIGTLLARLIDERDTHEGLVDEGWDRIAARPYVYPKDTGLSWHVDDHELYAGAFVYYAHPHWNAHWGGELLIAALGEGHPEIPIMGHRFENEDYSEQLIDMGCGAFVMPKPNRLVVLAGAPHMIARVSPAAGQYVRASVAGFFLRPKPG